MALETADKLLRKALKTFGGSPASVEALSYKEALREAGKRGLMDEAAVERWFAYRDNRNSAAHDYGASFAEGTLSILPGFLADARALSAALTARFGASGDA